MSSSALVLMQEPPRSQSVCFPLCDSDSNPIAPSASPVTPTPSVYLTFKVLQLVNTFRQRVKTRVQNTGRSSPKKTPAKFCQDFDRVAYEEIDRYLGRKTAHSRGKAHVPTGQTACATKECLSVSTKWLLDRINQAVQAETNSLTSVAASDKLFVQRKAAFTITADLLSTQELTELLVIVKDLLRSLSRLPSLSDREDSICEGNEVLDVDFDETCTANLEHLLLCLKDQLLRLLIGKLVALVRKHIVECQREQGQRSKTWFFEFPDAQHPLSTTWPWSIRPSLAVLWGVCWMFFDRPRHHDNTNWTNLPPRRPTLRFDSHMNLVNEQGRVVATSAQVIPFLSQLQQHHHGLQMGNARQVILPRDRLSPHAQTTATAPHHRGLMPSAHSSSPSPSHPFSRTSGATPGVAHGASAAFTLPDTNNNTYSAAAAPPAYDAGPAANPAINNWLPQDAAAFDYTESTAQTYHQTGHAWPSIPAAQSAPEHQQQQQQHQAPAFLPGYPPTLPPRSRHTVTPAISITTDFSNFGGGEFQPAPQDGYQSTTPVTSASSLHAPEPFNFAYNPNQLSPQNTRFMNPDQQQQQQEMQTPPRSPTHPAGAGESNSRKRSHSIMSGGQVAPQSNGSRSGSVVSMHGQSGEEDYPPRTRAFKRDEPPPMNEHQKIICTFAPECVGLTFERKCEWTKHMDKHDRPYRCNNPACAKLQGFTYSGGLLRHEREVHNKHGGPKSALMCPYEDCKRHNGKGFTRKENLNEHIRRVHQSKDDQAQGLSLKRDIADAFPGADNLDPAAAASMEAFDPEDQLSPAPKRRRQDDNTLDPNIGSDEVDVLKSEIRYLREENAAKESRILEMELRLEEEKQSRQEEMAGLHESMRQLQQQQQAAQAQAQAQAQSS